MSVGRWAGYLREIRLHRAHAALAAAGRNDTVGNIAFGSGFDNPIYFAHLFHQRFGLLPREMFRGERDPGGAPPGG